MDVWEIVKNVGPSGLVSLALIYLAREYQKLNDRHQALQEKRVEEAKQNTTAMLAIAERVHQSLDILERIQESQEQITRALQSPGRSPFRSQP